MEDEERKKKLQAGREKLAAFQRKRTKRKKRKKVTEDGESSDVYDSQMSETSSLADPHDLGFTSDMSALSGAESDHGSVMSEDFSEEEGSSSGVSLLSLERTRTELSKAARRITELEEALHGKQAALDGVVEENDRLRSSSQEPTQSTSAEGSLTPTASSQQGLVEPSTPSTSSERETDFADAKEVIYKTKLSEFESALKQRDEAIKQLTLNLQAATQSRDSAGLLQQEYMSQAQQLAQQVQTLQLQLQQAGEYLRNQVGDQHGTSVQALLEAKNEILALQQTIKQKITEITTLHEAVKQRDTALQQRDTAIKQMAAQCQEAAQQVVTLHAQNVELRERDVQNQDHMQKMISSVQEEMTTLRERDSDWTKKANEWQDREMEFGRLQENSQQCISEIKTLQETLALKDQSLQQMAVRLSETIQVSEAMVTRDQDSEYMRETLSEKENQLKDLKELLTKRDEELSERNTQLEAMHDSLAQKEQSLKALSSQLSQYTKSQEELVSLQEAFSNTSQNLESLQQNLQEKEYMLEEVKQKLKQKEDKEKQDMENLRETMKEKDAVLADLSSRLFDFTERNKELEAENKTFKDGQNESLKLQQELDSMKDIASKSKEYEEQIQQQLSEIQTFECKISELNKEIVAFQDHLNSKGEKITSLTEMLCDREENIKSLSQTVEENSSSIQEMSDRITHLTQELESVTYENEDLKKQQNDVVVMKQQLDAGIEDRLPHTADSQTIHTQSAFCQTDTDSSHSGVVSHQKVSKHRTIVVEESVDGPQSSMDVTESDDTEQILPTFNGDPSDMEPQESIGLETSSNGSVQNNVPNMNYNQMQTRIQELEYQVSMLQEVVDKRDEVVIVEAVSSSSSLNESPSKALPDSSTPDENTQSMVDADHYASQGEDVDIDKLHQTIFEQAASLSVLEETVTILRQENSSAREKHQESQEMYESLQQQCQLLQSELSSLQDKTNLTDQELKLAQSETQMNSKNVETVQEELRLKLQEFTTVQDNLNSVNEDYCKLQEEYDNLLKSLEVIQNENSQRKQDLESAQSNTASIVQEMTDLKNENTLLNEALQHSQNDSHSVNELLTATLEENVILKEKLSSSEEQTTHAILDLKSAEEALKLKIDEIELIQNEMRIKSREIESLIHANEKLKHSMESGQQQLSDELINLQQEIEGYKDREDALVEKERIVSERESIIRENESELERRTCLLQEKDVILTQKETSIAENEQTISERESSLQTKENALSDNETRLAEKELTLQERENITMQKETEIHTMELNIIELRKSETKVSELSDEIVKLKTAEEILSKEKCLLEETVRKTQENLQAYHDTLEQKESEVQQFQQAVVQFQQREAVFTQQVTQISQENLILKEQITSQTEEALQHKEEMKKLNWLTAENAALQSKISMSNDKIVKLQSQISEMPKLQEELEILRLRDNERELEMRTLQEKEKANSEVVKHMMFDIEQRRMEDSPAYQVGEPNSVDQHQKALEALQAELEELHGQQIVEMKQQLREQHSLEIEQVQKSSIEKHSQEFEQFQAECREEHSRELELIQKQLSESKTSALSIKEQHSQEIQLLQDDLRRFSESNNAANTDKVQLEKDLQHHRNEIQQLQNELKQLSANHMSVLAIKDQQEQDLRQEYASQLEQLQTQLKQMAQSQISEQTIKTQLYSELDNLNKEKEALAEKYHRSNQNSETLEHTIAEKDAVIQQQEEEKGFVESKLKSAYNQQQELFQKTASSNYDIISQLDQLRAQNSEYKDQIIELERNQHGSGTDLRNKLEAVERERDTVKAELKTVKITLFDYESRNPDLAVYRKKFDELNATLQVTWIENEELKAQVMNFKQQLGLDEPLEGATALNVDAGTVASTPLTSHSGDGTPSSSPSRGVKVLRRQIEQMKSEHAAEIENLRHDYEDVRAKLKEIEIERDSLRTKYEHEMRVKDKQHLESLTELSRQHQQVQSQLDRIHSEYREAQGKLQRSSEDRDIIQKQYNDALEKMRQEHSQVVAQMNRHIEQSTKTASPETADSIGNVQSAISGIGADQDQSVLITSERQELFIQRELLLAEKAQLVADRDSALQETEELKIVKQELNEKYAKLLSEKEELEGLKDTLVEMREINAELMKKNEILENEKEKVSLDNENISQELENVIITKGNMESLYQKDLKELENKISQLEEMVEYHKRSNEEIQGRFLSEADGSKDEIIQQLQIEIEHLRQTKENMNTEQSDMLDALQREHTEEVDNLRKQLIQLKDIEEKRNLAESQLEDKEREMVAYEEEYLRTVAGLNQEHDANIQDLQTQHQEDMNKLRNLIEELELEKSDLKAMQHGESVLVASEVITTSAAVPLSSERITCDYTSPLASSPHAQQEDQIAEWEGKLEDRRMDLTQALREQKYEMEWEHEVEMRKLRNELEIDHSENIKKLQEEFELRLIQKAESIKAEQELKFVEELRKARHELHRQSLSTEPVEAEAELETMVNKLKDENQELAEVRDALLNQIDCSHSQQMSLQEQIQTLHDHIHMAETDDVFVEEPHSGSFHEHVEEEEEEPSLQDSFEDYSEADLRAQINVLQRENLNLRNRLDDTNLTMLDGLQAELEDLQAKYTMVMKQKQTLDLSGEMGTEATGYQGLVLETDEGDVFSYEPPSHQMNNPEDYIDWKLRFEASEKEKDMLMHKLDSLSRTAQLSRHSQSVENLRARYETIMEENEVLRAKLGSYGLPTESTPEEDSFDFATKFDAVMKENENLRSKLDSYSMSSSQERDEDWRARYDSVIKDYEAMREYLEDNTMPLQDALLHGIQDLQSMYDSSIKDKENLQVKLDSICDQAEKDFAEHQAKYNKLIVEYQAFKAKFRRNREKSQKEHTKLKARFVAASKEIDVLKGKAESHGFEGDIVEDKDANDTEKNLTGAKDNLKSKNASLLAENKSLKSDNASLKGRLMDSFRTHLRETPPTQSSSSEQTTEALPLESPDTSNLEVKYSTACQEIVNLRSQLDAVQGRMLDDLNGYQAETEALAEKNEELGRNLDTKVQAAHLRIANLQSKCEDAIEMEESVTESIDWNTSMGDPGSDSDTSADSLNLEMETDYEVLVQEYERLKASGPEEIQRAYEAVVGHSRLEGSKKKGATEQNIAGEAKVTPQRGDSAKLRKRGKAKQKSEVVTDNTAQLGAEIDDESNDRQIGKENALVSLDRENAFATNPNLVKPKFSSTKHQIGMLSGNVGEMHEEVFLDDSSDGGIICNGHYDDCDDEHGDVHGSQNLVSNGSFIPETDSQEVSDLESDDSDLQHRLDWSVTEHEELQMHIDDLVIHIENKTVKDEIKKELIELCRKCCSLAEENDYLKTRLKESTHEVAELKVETHRHILQNAGAFSMDSSWDTIPEFQGVMKRNRSMNGLDMDESFREGNEKLKCEVKELKRIVSILRSENESLMRENAKMTSMFESQTAKASWEISLMKNSYEDEIDELKHRQTDMEGETNRVKEALASMRCQCENLVKENEEIEEHKSKVSGELEEARRTCSFLLHEKDRLEASINTNMAIVLKLQGADLQATKEAANGKDGAGAGAGDSIRDGSQSPNTGSQNEGAEQNGGGGDGRDDSMSSSGSSGGGASPNGESDVEDDSVSFKSIEELVKENEDLRKKLKAKSIELRQLQSFQRTYHSLVNENEKLKGDMKEKIDELIQVKGSNRTLLKDNESLEMKLNEAILKSSYELDEVRKRKSSLETENKALVEKLGTGISKAEKDLNLLKKKCDSILQEKEEIEFEYKTCKDKFEKDIANLTARYEEVCTENERLTSQINHAKTNAQKEVVEAHFSVEDMVVETETMQLEFEKGQVRNRREIDDLRGKVLSLKKEKREIKQQVDEFKKETDTIKLELTRSCTKLSEENNTLKSEVRELSKKYEVELRWREDACKKVEELSKNYGALERFHEEVKSEMTTENQHLKSKLGDMERDYEALSKTNEELKGSKASLQQELRDSQAWCELLESKMNDLEANLMEENENLNTSLKSLKDQLHIETENRKVLENDREDSQRKLEALQKMYNILELSYEDLQKGKETEVDHFRVELEDVHTKYEEALKSSKELALVKGDTVEKLKVMEQSFHGVEDDKAQLAAEIEILKNKVQWLEERQQQLVDEKSELTKEKDVIINQYKEQQVKYKEKIKTLKATEDVLTRECATKGEQLSELKDKFSFLTQEYDEINNYKNSLEKEYSLLLDRFNALEMSETDLQHRARENITNSKRLVEMEERITQLKAEREDLLKTKESILTENEKIKFNCEILEEEKAQASASKNALAGELEGLMNRLEDVTREKDEIIIQHGDLQAKYEKLEDEVDNKEQQEGKEDRQRDSEIRELQIMNGNLVGRVQELNQEKELMGQELIEIQSKYRGLQDMYERTKHQFAVEEKSLRDELRILQRQIGRNEPLEKDNDQLKKSQQSLQDELDDAKSKVQMLTSLLETAKRMTDKTNQEREYFLLQEKYLSTLRENEILDRKMNRAERSLQSAMALYKSRPSPEETGYSSLIEENSRLQDEKCKLEQEMKSLRIDREEMETVYYQLSELKEVKRDLDQRLHLETIVHRNERDALEKRLYELQSVLDELAESKGHVEQELEEIKEKYQNAIIIQQTASDRTKQMVEHSDVKARMHAAVIEAAELQNKLKGEQDRKELLSVEVAHLKKECDLLERHVKDLEQEVEQQCYQLNEVTRDHKDVLKLLTETRLELEIYRSKHRRDINKVEDLMHRVEANISGPGRASPRMHLFGRLSPHPSGSGHSTPRSPGRRSRGSSCSIHSFDEDGKPTMLVEDDGNRALETKHLQMVDEISHLRAELNAGSSSGDSSNRHSPIHSPLPIDRSDILAFREELNVIADRNNELFNERDELQERLREQEDLVIELQKQCNRSDGSESRMSELFQHQLLMLRQQRDQLIRRLEDDRERDQRILDLIREKGATEERFRQERDELRRKIHEKEIADKEMKTKISAMEKHIRKQQQLEELVQQKEELEGEISRQKQALENELGDVERRITERGSVLRSERASLVGETNDDFMNSSPSFGPRVEFSGVPPEGAYHVPPLYDERHQAIRSHISDQQVERLSRMKAVVERRYKVAIDRLRNELKQDVEQQKK